MNSYYKFFPNVWLAKTEQTFERNETIMIANKYGKESEHIVHNLIFSKNGFNFYSVERIGETYAERKAKRYEVASSKTAAVSDSYYEKSNKDRDFLVMGEPIKIGHHSERRHRKIIDQAHNNMRKCVEMSDKAREQERKAEYWKMKADEINLSSPESIEFFSAKLEQAIELQQSYKTGERAQEHRYSLSYATKAVKDIREKYKIAVRLWKNDEPEAIEPEAIEPEAIEPEAIEPEAIEPADIIEPAKPKKEQTPAQAIKTELIKAFPGVKFSAKYKTYSGGCSVDVSWENGPTSEAVRNITKKYQYNGSMQIDDYVPIDNLRNDIPQAGYVFENRTISREIVEDVKMQVAECYGLDLCALYAYSDSAQLVTRSKNDYLNSVYIGEGFEPDYIAWSRSEDERKEREYNERKQAEQEEKTAREENEVSEMLNKFIAEKWTFEEIKQFIDKKVAAVPVVYETPVSGMADFPNLNKCNTIEEYTEQLETGETEPAKVRIIGEIVLTEKQCEIVCNNLLYDCIPDLQKFGGSGLLDDPRENENWNCSQWTSEQREYYRKNAQTICLLAKSPSRSFLIDSQGSTYARYVGFLRD